MLIVLVEHLFRKKQNDPWVFFDRRYLQKWRNGSPVYTYDIPLNEVPFYGASKKRKIPYTGSYVDGDITRRKLLALAQDFNPRRQGLPHGAYGSQVVRQLPINVIGKPQAVADVTDVLVPWGATGNRRLLTRKGVTPSLQTVPFQFPAYTQPIERFPNLGRYLWTSQARQK